MINLLLGHCFSINDLEAVLQFLELGEIIIS